MERPFSQVVVWPGTLVGKDKASDFEAYVLEHLGAKIKYLEEIKTKPDMENGIPVEGTGGRNDVFFAIHEDDIPRFAVSRLGYGMRWIEDVLSNESADGVESIYPDSVKQYRTW